MLPFFLRWEMNLTNVDNTDNIPWISESLMECKSNFSEFVNQNRKKASNIFLAICDIGSVYLLKYLVDFHYDALNKVKCVVNRFGQNGLHLAVWNQNMAAVDILLKRVYFPYNDLTNETGRYILNQLTKCNETPVIYACRKKSRHSLAIFKLLLNYKCKLTPIKQDWWFPMYFASFCNHVTILKYMIINDIGTSTINTSGDHRCYTPLVGAIVRNNPQAIQILASFDKTDIDSIKCRFNNDSYTALECAAFFGNGTVLRILLRALLKQHKVSDWSSLIQTGIGQRIEQLKIVSKKKMTKDEHIDPCKRLLDNLVAKGLEKMDYEYVASTLRHNIPALIKRSGDKFLLPNTTVIVGHNYPYTEISKAAVGKLQFRTVSDVDVTTVIKSDDQVVGRWAVGELLGCGAFGNVLKGTDIQDGREVALKYMSLDKLSRNSKAKKTKVASFIMNELETVELIEHKNVIKLLAYNLNVDDNATMLLVFEYAQYGELYQFLAINNYFSNDIAKTYFEQILDALEVCHAMGVIHRDLKPQNILLDSKYQAKVADFGLSTYDNDLTNKNLLYVGTRGYMSPEIASPMIEDYDDETDEAIYKEIDSSCDVFSLGVILWQLLNGIESMPFDQAIQSDPKFVYIAQKEFDLFWKCHYNCRIVNKASNNVQNLLLQMFAFDPDKRISISDIRKHKWYSNVPGYNGNKESQLFFQDTMQEIHKQLRLKQMVAIQSMLRYESTTIEPKKSGTESQAKVTTFELVKLRYVAMCITICIII